MKNAILKNAGLLNESVSYYGIAREDIYKKMRSHPSIAAWTGKKIIDEFFNNVKSLPKDKYEEFAKKNNIDTLSVFNGITFKADDRKIMGEFLSDWDGQHDTENVVKVMEPGKFHQLKM